MRHCYCVVIEQMPFVVVVVVAVVVVAPIMTTITMTITSKGQFKKKQHCTVPPTA